MSSDVIPKVELDAEPRACRVCLATDTKLFYLPTHPLADTFDVLTGTPVSVTDGLPQHVCSICGGLLRKYSAFRDKCWAANVILQVARTENQLITTEYIRNIDRTHLEYNLTITTTQNIDFIPKKGKILKKEKRKTKSNEQIDVTLHYDNPNDDSNNEQISEVINNDDNAVDDNDANIKQPNVVLDKDDMIDSDNGFDESICSDSKTLFIGIDNLFETETKIETVTGPETEHDTKKVKRIAKRKAVKRFEKNKKINRPVSEKVKKDCTNLVERKKKVRVTKLSNSSKWRQKYSTKEELDELSKAYNVDIVILSKEEQRKQIEDRKETANYKNSQFKCEVCFKGFQKEFKLKSHMVVHDPSIRKYSCDICHFHFTTVDTLYAHTRFHKMNLLCKECNHVSKCISEAKQHFNWHKGVTFECEHCGKCFIKIKSKKEHCRIHHGSTTCTICGGAFSGQFGLKTHMKKSHKEAVDAVCATCSVQFHSVEALSKHACEPGALPCAQCGDSFCTEEALKQHQQEQHRGQGRKNNMEINCLKCGDSFTSEKLHRMHLNRVHNIKTSLTVQRRQDAGTTGNYKNKDAYNVCICEMCGLYLTSQAALREHQRIHTGEKPYQCNHCPKSFRQKVQLQHHIYTHTDERPYKCPECPKAFTQAMNRNRHQLVHTKERPAYECNLCDKTYQTPRGLKLHVKTTHLNEAWPKRERRRTNTINNEIYPG